jgi:hypothetical protein
MTETCDPLVLSLSNTLDKLNTLASQCKQELLNVIDMPETTSLEELCVIAAGGNALLDDVASVLECSSDEVEGVASQLQVDAKHGLMLRMVHAARVRDLSISLKRERRFRASTMARLLACDGRLERSERMRCQAVERIGEIDNRVSAAVVVHNHPSAPFVDLLDKVDWLILSSNNVRKLQQENNQLKEVLTQNQLLERDNLHLKQQIANHRTLITSLAKLLEES